MRTKATATFVAAALAASCLLPDNADAAIILNIEQVGSDVVASYSGSWDTFTRFTTAVVIGNYVFEGLFYALGTGPKDYMSAGSMSLTSGTWTDIYTEASSVSGDPFGFNLGGDYFAPEGYIAGQSLSGSLTFANTDLVTMGFTPDSSGVFSGAGNTVNFTVSGAAAVPEPGTWAAAALLAAGATFARWRRGKAK